MEIASGFTDSGTCCLLTDSIFLITVGCFTKWLENVLFRVFDTSDVTIDMHELNFCFQLVLSVFLSFLFFLGLIMHLKLLYYSVPCHICYPLLILLQG